jgi:hypothetical protein
MNEVSIAPRFDINEYLDFDFSGGHANFTSSHSTNLTPLTIWLKQYGFKDIITEFDAANRAQRSGYVTVLVRVYGSERGVYWRDCMGRGRVLRL